MSGVLAPLSQLCDLSPPTYSQAEWNKLSVSWCSISLISGYSCQVSLIVLGQVPDTTRCYLENFYSMHLPENRNLGIRLEGLQSFFGFRDFFV